MVHPNDYDILLTQPGRAKFPQDHHSDEFKDYITNITSLRIGAQLGNYCTYKCTYCSPEDSDGTAPWPEEERFNKLCELVDEIDQVYRNPPYNKKHIIWELLGGEITVWKNIERFIEYVSSKGHHMQLVTNGVRSIRWWETYGKLFKHITLSYHPEFADYKHITDVGNILNTNNVAVSTMIMMYPDKWDKILEAINYMRTNATFPVSVKTLYQKGANLSGKWPYTPEQEKFIQDVVVKKTSDIPKTEENITHYSTFAIKKLPDGTYDGVRVDMEDIINSDKNIWTGWKCNVGIDTLYIDPTGKVKISSSCFLPYRGILFNWITSERNTWKFPTKPVICEFKSCYCGHDIRARKEKI